MGADSLPPFLRGAPNLGRPLPDGLSDLLTGGLGPLGHSLGDRLCLATNATVFGSLLNCLLYQRGRRKGSGSPGQFLLLAGHAVSRKVCDAISGLPGAL